jgi:hypothetical protein
MNWLKENPFLAGLAAVTLAAAGALAYLIFDASSAYSQSAETYSAAVDKLHKLQTKVPFPSAENLKALQLSRDDYAARILALQSQLAKMEVPLDTSITPQKFMDDLRAAVNDIRKSADEKGVRLPEKFYFGFDQYQTQVPTDLAAPALFRQFRVIQGLVVRLVDFKVASVDSINRDPLPEEAAAPQAAGQKKEAPPEPVFRRFKFDIAFTAEQGKVRTVVNSVLAPAQFLIIRSLSLQNTSPTAPAKVSADSAAQPVNPFAAAPAADKKSLQVILGRELIKTTLRLEMFDFAEPPAPKK